MPGQPWCERRAIACLWGAVCRPLPTGLRVRVGQVSGPAGPRRSRSKAAPVPNAFPATQALIAPRWAPLWCRAPPHPAWPLSSLRRVIGGAPDSSTLGDGTNRPVTTATAPCRVCTCGCSSHPGRFVDADQPIWFDTADHSDLPEQGQIGGSCPLTLCQCQQARR